MNFEEALYNQLSTLPNWTVRQTKLSSIIQNPSQTNSYAIRSLERKVRTEFDMCQLAQIDWGCPDCASSKKGVKTAINWAAILQFIEQQLPALIAEIEALFSGS